MFIYVGGSWGPICAQEYNSKPSLCDIMCHELGYQRCNNWVQVPEGEVFSEPVITDLQCRAGARSLQDCTFESTRSCPHSPGQTSATGDYLEVACNDWDITGDTYGIVSNYETSHFSYYNYKDDGTYHFTIYKHELPKKQKKLEYVFEVKSVFDLQ